MARPKKESKVKKTRSINVHLSELDYELIKKKAEKVNLPMSEFLRQTCFKTHISVPDTNLVRILSELSKIGANLNQLTKKVNANGINLSENEKKALKSLRMEFDEIRKVILK